MATIEIEKLDVDNYATWSVKVKSLLVLKDLWRAVSGAGDVRGADEKALAQILLYVKDHHIVALSKCETAKQAWDKLKDAYQAKSTARRLQLKRELNALNKDGRAADQVCGPCHRLAGQASCRWL